MNPVRVLYFMTLNFIFKVNHFLVVHWVNKCGCHRYIYLDSHGLRRVVVLIKLYLLKVTNYYLLINIFYYLDIIGEQAYNRNFPISFQALVNLIYKSSLNHIISYLTFYKICEDDDQ